MVHLLFSKIESDHMIMLRDPEGQRTFRRPVHINRTQDCSPYVHLFRTIILFRIRKILVVAIHRTRQQTKVRAKTRDNNEQTEIETQMSSAKVDKDINQRPKRVIRKPLRYRDPDVVDPNNIDMSSVSENENPDQMKVKRILAKRKDGGNFIYLVQQSGEPAQNAVWLPGSKLPPKALEMLKARPPPVID